MVLNKFKELTSELFSAAEGDSGPIVALDIGTENIKALVVQVSGGKIKVIGEGRSKQGLTDMQAGAIADIPEVIANCDKALRKAEEESGYRGSRAVVGIAGELIKGVTNTIHIKRENPETPLEVEEIDDIIKHAQSEAYSRAKEDVLLEIGSEDVELKLVNSALVSISIDGYKVTNPEGFQGTEVEVQLYTAFSPLVHIGAIEHVVRDLDLELLAVAAEPFAVSRSIIGDDPEPTTSAILIDVGGGTTDIAVLRDGGLEGTQMFGIGGRSFTKALARHFDVSFEAAEVLKLRYSKNELKADKRDKVAKIIDEVLEVWVQGVELALSEFDWIDVLPSNILLCGGGASLPEVSKKLRSSDWHKDLAFAKTPKARFIPVEDVVGLVDTTGRVNDHTIITALGLARVGSDTSGTSKSGGVKGKINKLLES